MTQAFNLAQLANNLNTSGQLDATDGLSGLVTNANLASSGTASSTTFLRGDRTWAIAGLQAASTAEAQAGTSDTVAITPLKMRQGFNASGSAPVYACRAWVNFNGTTATIRSSGNVSSITYISTGYYRINFSVVMPTNNYAVTGISNLSITQLPTSFVTNSSNFEVYTTTTNAFADASTATFAVFC
jgi:hypothetical protein